MTTPLKNRHAGIIVEAWRIIKDNFSAAGVTPNTYVMDNEATWDLKKATKEKNYRLPISASPHPLYKFSRERYPNMQVTLHSRISFT